MYNFGLDHEQRQLTEALRKYLQNELPIAATREIISSGDRFASTHWRALADLGFIGLGIPDEYGGGNLGCTEMVAIAEELGRAMLPAPYVETVAVADLIARAGNAEQKNRLLRDICSGDCVATLAADEPGAYWSVDHLQASATASGDRFVLSGTKLWSAYAHVADLIVCPVRMGGPTDDIGLVALRAKRLGARIHVLDAIDDAYPLCELSLEGLIVSEADFIGLPRDARAHWTRTEQLATLLNSAVLVGGIERGLEMLVGFSKDRTQFGKPIGSYQAVKHRCADILTDLETVRGSVYFAAWAKQQNSDNCAMATSAAKALASDAAVRAAEKCLQSFGAIGFTWEHDIHFYLKRAKRIEMTLGDASFHRERIASLIFSDRERTF